MEDRSLHRSECPPWPKTLIATLTLLGVFKGRPINANRPCLLCCCRKRIPHNDMIDCGIKIGTENESDENDNHNIEDNKAAEVRRLISSSKCAVCSSLLWNADGVVVTNFIKAVPGCINNNVCGIMSNLLIALFLICSIITLGWYVQQFWGQIKDVTHLVSFLAYGVILIGVALICTVSNAMQYIRRTPWKKHAEVLHQDYIARRLRCLAGRRFLLPDVAFLSFSMIWVLINSSLQIVNLIHFVNANDTGIGMNSTSDQPSVVFQFFKTSMVVVVSIIGLPIYASFWYYVLVMRRALTAEFNLVLVFIKRNEGNLDWCRCRIVEINRDFCLLRSVLARLMPLIVASAVLGLTVHVTWNYEVYSGTMKYLAKYNLLINIVIFSEKFMVLILPVLAVGGLNIDQVWQQFNYALTRQRNTNHDEFWDRLLNFTTELHAEHKGHNNLTLFLSVISLYLGRNLSEQKLDYRGGLLV